MRKSQQGFTIMEIFIALAIGLALFAGVFSVFVGMKSTSNKTSSYGELQENGRFAMSLITSDLLRQNFWGDLSGSIALSGLVSSPNPVGNSGECTGEGANNLSFPFDVGHFRTIWGANVTSANMMSCITNAKTSSDLLQIKRAIAQPLLEADIEDDRYYIISNSNTAAIFAGDDGAVPTVNIGQIWEYQHHIYYVREDIQGSNKVPVLVQGRLQNDDTAIMTFDMMVEGIERLHFMFGVDTDSDGVVNAFLSAENMTDDYWDNADDTRILAVKVYILVRDILPDVSYENENIYQMGDKPFEPDDGDNYRRLLFTSTVTLHNARVDSW